jgi:hypothetical protein
MPSIDKIATGAVVTIFAIMAFIIWAAIEETKVQRAMYEQCIDAKKPQYECYALIYKSRR